MPVLIPLESNGKRPAVKGWASPDYQSPQNFAGNVGLRTDGIVVVDADSDEASMAWGARPGAYTPYRVSTPKGVHHYYRLPDGVRLQPSVNAELKLDVRSGPGSFVVIPPSTIGEASYEWLRPQWDFDLANLPEAPLDLIRSIQPTREAPESSDEGWEKIPEGRRNVTLTALAGALRRQGAGAAAIANTLATFNANRVDPPVDDGELLNIVRSVLRYEPEPDEAAGDIDIQIDGEPELERHERPPVVWAGSLEVPPPPRWLLFPFLPAGRLVLVDGNEGIGKGMFATWVAANLAKGTFGEPGTTLWGSTEDDPAEDILRRLLAAGYDAEHHAPIGFLNGDALAWRYPVNIGPLAQLVRDTNAKVLILDPGRSFLGPPEGMGMTDFSFNNEAAMRPGLEALNLLARKLDVMVLFIHHWNKNLTASIRVRSSGSGAFAQTVRHRITLAYQEGEHAIAVEKSNLTKRENTVMGYTLPEVEAFSTARFEWGEPQTAIDLDEWEKEQRGESRMSDTEEAALNASLVAAEAEQALTPGKTFWNRQELSERFGFSQRLSKAVLQELKDLGFVRPGARNQLAWVGAE